MMACELLAKGFCRRWNAKNRDGVVVDPLDPNACKWCAKGALQRAYASRLDLQVQIEKRIEQKIGGRAVVNWNDDESVSQAKIVRIVGEAELDILTRLLVTAIGGGA